MSASIWPTSLSTLIKSRTLLWSVFYSWHSLCVCSPSRVVFRCCNICKISSHAITKCTELFLVASNDCLEAENERQRTELFLNKKRRGKRFRTFFVFRKTDFFGSKSFFVEECFGFGRLNFGPNFFLLSLYQVFRLVVDFKPGKKFTRKTLWSLSFWTATAAASSAART